jgi:membrane protein implicated in regulation of membrane protease activity
MNRNKMAVAGVAACAAACAGVSVAPALLGAGIFSVGGLGLAASGLSADGILCSLVLAAVAGGLGWLWLSRRQKADPSCAVDGSCGCSDDGKATTKA